jgi:hypothetical protein
VAAAHAGAQGSQPLDLFAGTAGLETLLLLAPAKG